MPDSITIKQSLAHPVIDADGHWLEYWPVVRELMRQVGGEAASRAISISGQHVRHALKMSPKQRREKNVPQEAFWGVPLSLIHI